MSEAGRVTASTTATVAPGPSLQAITRRFNLSNALDQALDRVFAGDDADQFPLGIDHGGEAEAGGAKTLDDAVGRLGVARDDDAAHVTASDSRRVSSNRMSSVLTRPIASPSSEMTGSRSTLCAALRRNASSIEVSGRDASRLSASGTMTSDGADVPEIDDVVDHRAFGRGERTFALALDRDLFQFLARDEEAAPLRRGAEAEDCRTRSPISRTGQSKIETPFEHAAERGERAKRKTAKERFRQNAEHKKINRQRDHERADKTGSAEMRRRAAWSGEAARGCPRNS